MKRYSLIFVILGLLTVLSVDALAQTRKRKPRRTVPPPVTTQQIIEQTQPEIIGQTDTRQEETPVTTETETPTTTETPIGGSGSFQEKIDQFNTRIIASRRFGRKTKKAPAESRNPFASRTARRSPARKAFQPNGKGKFDKSRA